MGVRPHTMDENIRLASHSMTTRPSKAAVTSMMAIPSLMSIASERVSRAIFLCFLRVCQWSVFTAEAGTVPSAPSKVVVAGTACCHVESWGD